MDSAGTAATDQHNEAWNPETQQESYTYPNS